jgi:2-polyprenyl-3-methyl-5-hydroxy-6-metoxy-1,4-benzoquinol methylase
MNLIKTKLINTKGIYFMENHKEFGYSDGDINEKYIKKIIKNAKDVSSSSIELEKGIRGWSSKYHLSKDRVNAYRSINFSKNDLILEVGAGCGSITRYLGEEAGNIVAIEGSSMRAEIIKERTRDLNNVTIVCAPFQDVEFTEKFDYIVCNGVFEYSSSFVKEEDPYSHILKLFSSLLSENGVLIIAIENRYGIKYFASSREDHTNIMFDGVEGYSNFPKKVQTFGIEELSQSLSEYFTHNDVLIPLPDYKFPKAVLHEKMLSKVNAQGIFSNFVASDYLTYAPPLFNEKLAYKYLNKNKLLLTFSNSFMFISSKNKIQCFDENWLGSVYKTNRSRDNSSVSNFIQTDKGGVEVKKQQLFFDCQKSEILNLDSEKWIDGDSVHDLLLRSLYRKDLSDLKEILYPVIIWWKYVQIFKDEKKLKDNNKTLIIDFIWQNSILKNNRVEYIDTEWEVDNDIEIEYLLFRAIYTFFVSEMRYFKNWNSIVKNGSIYSITCKIFKTLGLNFSLKKMYNFMCKESVFESKVLQSESQFSFVKFISNLIRFSLVLRYKNVQQSIFLKRDSVYNIFQKFK